MNSSGAINKFLWNRSIEDIHGKIIHFDYHPTSIKVNSYSLSSFIVDTPSFIVVAKVNIYFFHNLSSQKEEKRGNMENAVKNP